MTSAVKPRPVVVLPRGGWIRGRFEGDFEAAKRASPESPTSMSAPLAARVLDVRLVRGIVRDGKATAPPLVTDPNAVIRQPRLLAWVEVGEDEVGRPRVHELMLEDVHVIHWQTDFLIDDLATARGALRGTLVCRLGPAPRR